MTPGLKIGFTLVEVVVAFVILSLTLAAATGTLVRASRTARDSDLMEGLLWTATGVADSLELVAAPVPGGLDLPDGSRIRWSASRVDVFVPEGAATWVELALAPALGRLTLESRP